MEGVGIRVCLVAIYCVQKRAVSNLDVNNVILTGSWTLKPVHDVFHFRAGGMRGWGEEGEGRDKASMMRKGGRQDDQTRPFGG